MNVWVNLHLLGQPNTLLASALERTAAAPKEEVVDASAHATSGEGSAADPWLGWEPAALQGLPTFFCSGYFATAGITAYSCNLTIPGPRCVGGVRVEWRGSGQTDPTTQPGVGSRGGGTAIVALAPIDGVPRPLLQTIGVRYVTIEHMTLDGNWNSNVTLVIDGPSVNSFGLLDLFLTGARNITFDIAPTWNTQVSEASVSNCVIQSIFRGDYDKSGDDHHHPGRAQVRVGSTNTLDISFYAGIIDGNGEFNILFEGGGITMYDIAMGGATVADIYFATNVCLIKMFGCHSESHGMFIMAPKVRKTPSWPRSSANSCSLL
jgi:hypothetical protein